MGQCKRTFYLIAVVIDNGGRMEFDALAEKLIEADPQRFPSKENVKSYLNKLTECLYLEGNEVIFDKDAKKYSKIQFLERDVSRALNLPSENFKNLRLYPYKDRENSEECYLGISWKNIPGIPNFPKLDMCDYRSTGEEVCNYNCGVDRAVRIKSLLELDEKTFLKQMFSSKVF